MKIKIKTNYEVCKVKKGEYVFDLFTVSPSEYQSIYNIGFTEIFDLVPENNDDLPDFDFTHYNNNNLGEYPLELV